MCSSKQYENRNQCGEIISLLYEKRDLHNNIKENIVLTIFAYIRHSKNMWMDPDIKVNTKYNIFQQNILSYNTYMACIFSLK